METPVTQLRINLSGQEAVEADLPWELFTPAVQKELDRCDSNDDGILDYAPELDYSRYRELTHLDNSADRFARYWARLGGDYPNNNYSTDERTYPVRMKRMKLVQEEVWQTLVEPMLQGAGPADRKAWLLARRILATLGDAEHLYRTAEMLVERFFGNPDLQALENDLKKDRRLLASLLKKDEGPLQTAELFLLDAESASAVSRWQRSETLEKTVEALDFIGIFLDLKDGIRLNDQKKGPYLLAFPLSPVTLNLRPGEEGGRFSIRVAVPKGMTPQETLRDFQDLPGAQKIFLRPAFQNDDAKPERYPLPVTGWSKEEVGEDHWTLIRPVSLQKRLFKDRNLEDRKYGFLTFELPNARKLLAGQEVRLFNIEVERNGKVERVIEESFVLQDKDGRTVLTAVSSDPHQSEAFDLRLVWEMAKSLAADAVDLSKSRGSLSHLFRGGPEFPDRSEHDPDLLKHWVERVERFYSPHNGNVEYAQQEWSEGFYDERGTRHPVDRQTNSGDLVEFDNIDPTHSSQPYRKTNYRRFYHTRRGRTVSLKFPESGKPGNHDERLGNFALQVYPQGFGSAPEVYEIVGRHFDRPFLKYRSSISAYVNTIFSLLPRECEDGTLDCPAEAVKEILAPHSGTWGSEEGMGPYYRYLDGYEADVTHLGNGLYHGQFRSRGDYFSGQRWMFEEAHEPVGSNIVQGAKTYLQDKHVNGKGMFPKTYRFFLQSNARIMAKKERVFWTSHHQNFAPGESAADQTQEAAGALDGDPNWALRMAMDHFVYPDGSPVIVAIFPGHGHMFVAYAREYRWDLPGDSPEAEASYRRDRTILMDALTYDRVPGPEVPECPFKGMVMEVMRRTPDHRIPDDKIYDLTHHLWHEYRLDERIVVHRDLRRPGEVTAEFNRDSKAFGKRWGTFSGNLRSVGELSGNALDPGTGYQPTGYTLFRRDPDGSFNVTSRVFHINPDGTVISGTDDQVLEAIRGRVRKDARHWKTSHVTQRPDGTFIRDAVQVPPVDPNRPPEGARTVIGPYPKAPQTFDYRSLICQTAKVCPLGLVAEAGMVTRFDGAPGGYLRLGTQLTVWTTAHRKPLIGFNYLRWSAAYAYFDTQHSLYAEILAGLGVVDPFFYYRYSPDVSTPTSNRSHHLGLGGALLNMSAAAIFAPVLFFEINPLDPGDFLVGTGFRYHWDILSWKIPSLRHH